MHGLVKEAWDREWNYSEEFYCTVDAGMTVTSANSAFKEWWEVTLGEKLVGLTLSAAARINPLVGVDGSGWMITRRSAVRVEGDVIYHMKRIFDGSELVGYVVKVKYLHPNIMELDYELAQYRLNGNKPMPANVVKLN